MTDLISRQATIKAVENTDWYHIDCGELVQGANSETDTPLFKADDIFKVLDSIHTERGDSDRRQYQLGKERGYVELRKVLNESKRTDDIRRSLDKLEKCIKKYEMTIGSLGSDAINCVDLIREIRKNFNALLS